MASKILGRFRCGTFLSTSRICKTLRCVETVSPCYATICTMSRLKTMKLKFPLYPYQFTVQFRAQSVE